MESILIKKGKIVYLKIYYLYKNSFSYNAFINLFIYLKTLTSASKITQWFSSNDYLIESLKKSKILKCRNLLPGNVLISVLKESKIIVFLIQKKIILLLIFIQIFTYPLMPTAISILISVPLIVLMVIYIFFEYRFGKLINLLNLSLVFFIGFLLISLFFNYFSSDGISIFITYLSTLMFIILITVIVTESNNLINLIHIVTGLVFVLSMYGIYQIFTGVQVDPAWLDENANTNVIRIYSVFGNPNVFGEFLVLTLPLVFAGFNLNKKVIVKWAYALVFLTGIINVFLTFSRGSMLSLVIALFLIVLFKDRKYMILMIAGILLSPLVLPQSIIERILSIFQGGDTSTSYRISIYKASFEILEKYFSTGVGLGNFKVIYKAFSFSAAKSYHAHNTFLMIFIETGILGVISFSSVLLIWVREIFSAQKKDTMFSYYAFASFAGIVGCSIQGLVDHIWHNYDILFFYFLIIAVGYISANLAKEQT